MNHMPQLKQIRLFLCIFWCCISHCWFSLCRGHYLVSPFQSFVLQTCTCHLVIVTSSNITKLQLFLSHLGRNFQFHQGCTTLVSFVVLHKTSREELNGLWCYIVMMQSALAFLFGRTILFLANMSDALWHFQ